MAEESDIQPGITAVLKQIRLGNDEARRELFRLVYDDLHRMAKQQMQKERKDHTLQTTAIVHEAFIRMVGSDGLEVLADRAHFLAVAGRTMRQLLIDHARMRKAQRRGGAGNRVLIDDVLDDFEQRHSVDYLDLEDALGELSQLDVRQGQIVELRFFAGLSVKETADYLGVSSSTVEKDFKSARSWLNLRLQ